MIEVSNLLFSYGSGKVNQKTISFPGFSITEGQHFLLLGESGSGKTTLLHLLGGLLKPMKGKIEMNGTDITKLSERQLDQFRGKHLGFIFQRNHLINALSVKENVLMAPFLSGKKQDVESVKVVLRKLGLAENTNAKVSELSQGQAQRVAIARALITQPSIILADEPTSALDDSNCFKVIDLLEEMAGEVRATLIIATHDQRLKERIKNQIRL